MQALQGGQVGGLHQLQQRCNEVPKVLQAEAVCEMRQALQGGQQERKALPQLPAAQLLACIPCHPSGLFARCRLLTDKLAVALGPGECS